MKTYGRKVSEGNGFTMKKVYKNRYCKCGCGERITVKEYHKRYGIPRFIYGHQCRGKNNPMYQHVYTQKTLDKMSKNHADFSGKKHPNYGVHRYGEDNPNYVDGYAQERGNAKLCGQGFISLNHKSKIANTMHHLEGNEYVIFIPEKLHKRYYHSHSKSHPKYKECREKIDTAAYMWMWKELERDYKIKE